MRAIFRPSRQNVANALRIIGLVTFYGVTIAGLGILGAGAGNFALRGITTRDAMTYPPHHHHVLDAVNIGTEVEAVVIIRQPLHNLSAGIHSVVPEHFDLEPANWLAPSKRLIQLVGNVRQNVEDHTLPRLRELEPNVAVPVGPVAPLTRRAAVTGTRDGRAPVEMHVGAENDRGQNSPRDRCLPLQSVQPEFRFRCP